MTAFPTHARALQRPMAQPMSEPPCSKSTYSKCCQKVRDGTIKEGDPEYEITLTKIKGYTAWQESAGVKVRTTANTAAAKTLLSIKKTGEDTNKRVAGMEPKIEELHADMQGRHSAQRELEEKKLEVVKAKAEAKKEEREAFEKKVEAGDGTTLEQAKFDAAKAQAKVRKIQEDLKIEKMREKAEKKEALAASRPPATKRTAEASTTEAKRRRRDPNATAAPTTEAREYKVGEIVKLKSKNDGKEFDGIIKSKEEHGYYRVWVQELDKTILRKLPLRAASSK